MFVGIEGAKAYRKATKGQSVNSSWLADEDLVKRLRDVTEDDAYAHPWTFGVTCKEAADHIEQLEAEVARLKNQRDCARKTTDILQGWFNDKDARLTAMTANAEALAGHMKDAVSDRNDHGREMICWWVSDAEDALTNHRKLMEQHK